MQLCELSCNTVMQFFDFVFFRADLRINAVLDTPNQIYWHNQIYWLSSITFKTRFKYGGGQSILAEEQSFAKKRQYRTWTMDTQAPKSAQYLNMSIDLLKDDNEYLVLIIFSYWSANENTTQILNFRLKDDWRNR